LATAEPKRIIGQDSYCVFIVSIIKLKGDFYIIMKKSKRLFLSAVLAGTLLSFMGEGYVGAADTNLAADQTNIVAGKGATNNPYTDKQHGSVAIGENATTDTMAGKQEQWLALGQTNPDEYPGSIAIGENAYARTGSVQIGIHNYTGKMGNTTITADTNDEAKLVGVTTIGTNSYNKAAFGTLTGTYSVISGTFKGNNDLLNKFYGIQNFGANIVGSLNSIESEGFGMQSGIANSIVGTANRTSNSNGSLIFGAGNEITNSINSSYNLNMFQKYASAQELQEALRDSVRSSNSGGSTMAIGGGNKADWVQASQIIGANNTLQGSKNALSKYNLFIGNQEKGTSTTYVSAIGANNTFTNSAYDLVIGNNHNYDSSKYNVVFGSLSAASDTPVEASYIVVMGDNAQATANYAVAIGANSLASKVGAVALGANSVASIDKGQRGYDPNTDKASTNTSSTWKATAAAVSVGDTSKDITRQINGVAAGTLDTDAVNVAQLKQAVLKASGSQPQPTLSEGDNISIEKTGSAETGYNYKISAKLDGYATKDSDIKFGGDSGNTITTKLNEQLNIKGGVTDKTNLTDNNIGVVSDGKQLNVKLAKNIKDVDTITVNKSIKVGDKISITKNNIDMGNTAITNLQDGVNRSDAATYGQLKDLDETINNHIDNIDNRVDVLDGRINQVGAGAAALASLHPLDFNTNDKFEVAVGVGSYRGASAAAIGMFYHPTERIMFNLGSSLGNSSNMWNAGLSFKLGPKSRKDNTVPMAQQVAYLKNDTVIMQDQIQKLTLQNASLEAMVNKLLKEKK
jgi:hypothetical protein